MQRDHARLGAEAEDEQREGDPHHAGVQLIRVHRELAPVQRAGRRDARLPSRVVDEDRAQVGQCDPDRADHHVLPGRLHRATAAPVADEERGDDRGGLDRHPQDAEVVGEYRQHHGRQERGHQRRVAAQVAACDLTRRDLAGHEREARPGRDHTHRPDHDQHHGRERVDPQHRGRGERVTVDGQHRREHPAGQDGDGRHHRDPAGRPARPTLCPGDHPGDHRRGQRSCNDQGVHQSQSLSCRRSSMSVPPKAARSRAVSTCRTSTTKQQIHGDRRARRSPAPRRSPGTRWRRSRCRAAGTQPPATARDAA